MPKSYAGIRAPGPGSLVDPQHPLGNGCIGCWWPNAAVDAGRGLWVPDLSGHGQTAQFAGSLPTWAASRNGAWGTNISSDAARWLKVPLGPAANRGTEDFSILIGLTTEATIGMWPNALDCRTKGGTYGWSYCLAAGGGNGVFIDFCDADQINFTLSNDGTKAYTAGVWNTLAITLDRDGYARSYKQGAQHGSVDISSAAAQVATPAAGGYLRIGADFGEVKDYRLVGVYEFIVIWNYALPPEYMAWLYREPAAMIWEPGRRKVFTFFEEPYVEVKGTIQEDTWTGKPLGTAEDDYRLLLEGAYLTSRYNRHVPDADTLLSWSMEEEAWNGTAGEVVDDSGLGNHGMAVGNVQPGDSLMGHGADAGTSYGWPYLRGPNLTGWQAAGKLTVSCWVYVHKWTSATTDGSIVCQAAYPAEWTNPYRSWGIICNATGQTLWLMASGNTGWKSGLVPLNEWTHLALTWDGSTVRGYVNGVLQATGSAPWAWTDQIGPVNVLNELGGLRSSPAGKDWVVDELVVSKVVRTIDPARYATSLVRCSPLDAEGSATWTEVTVASPAQQSTETWGLYVQATDSATVPEEADENWQAAAVGQVGDQVLDLTGLGLTGRYLHRMWLFTPSTEAKAWDQASIGACTWNYTALVPPSSRRLRPLQYGPSLQYVRGG